MIGTKELLKLVQEKKLVENLCSRELENPEGAGFDLRLGEIFKINEGQAFLGENERFTPEAESLAIYGKHKDFILKPGDYVLVKTIEKLNLPKDIAAIFRPRSTLQRCGITLITATASPGYSGELTFGMHNLGKNELKLELGARIAHVIFFNTTENISEYRGQWQNGRVSTQGKPEVQV
ncbi:MAG: dCTP deaminase [Candidatus Pacearchaeota archaeon]|nr:dCTP deaminase [Candidatus Pacearchaeota archaeon]